MKPGELVKPECGEGHRGVLRVPIWGHPLKRHWRDAVGWWNKGQSGVVIEMWETQSRHGEIWLRTGYKYKIIAADGCIGWVDDSNIELLETDQ